MDVAPAGGEGSLSSIHRPTDLYVTTNRAVKTRLLLKSPQTTGVRMLKKETLITPVTFVKLTPGSREVMTVVDLVEG